MNHTEFYKKIVDYLFAHLTYIHICIYAAFETWPHSAKLNTVLKVARIRFHDTDTKHESVCDADESHEIMKVRLDEVLNNRPINVPGEPKVFWEQSAC